ncbi:hypothetical protein GCM10010965_25690 [Caldalkalibacillus thermarum]|uniref:phage/plasmid primase, P4 family n=1 Tax=Caldalkalibacillus thermarum TaxID=296745 RepID=UPI00166AF652|nr:phage/plasmid primase, P4 family [Caldalkalibacillus thermarum]GGK31705.1 hypothetical protein GCM10010965_25690 [Caldalkalibacillus thermarum]
MTYPYHITNDFDLKAKLENLLPHPIRWKGVQGMTRCPFHDDRNPSFTVNVEKGVWHCFAGCGSGTVQELVKRLGGDLKSKPKQRKHQHEYVYTDAEGNPVLMVARDDAPQGKRIVQYHHKDGQWYTGKGHAKPVPYNLPLLIRAIEAGNPVFVVEGEKCADALSAFQCPATTNAGGAGKWPQDETYNAYFKGADVILIPDNDEVGKKHMIQVAQALKPFVNSMKWLNLDVPEKGDVYDWLKAGHTPKELWELAKEAETYEPPAPLTVIEGGRDVVRQKYFDGGKFVPAWLAEDIMRDVPVLFDTQQLFIYQDGVYVPDNGDWYVKKLCQDRLGIEYRQNREAETIAYIKRSALIDTDRLNPDDGLINVRNGLLNWRSGKLLPHTHERLSTIQLPVEYHPNAKCPHIQKFLQEVMPGDAIPVVLEFLGYCLVTHTRYEKALMLTGTGANGKSVFIHLLTALVGKENAVSVPFQELADSRWKRADLQGKLVNTFADISHKAVENSGVFKAIVSGDTIDAERKGKDPFYYQPFAKLVFSANELPSSLDVSDGYFRRWLIVPFPNRFEGKKADKKLLDKLTTPEELSGLLNLAVEGLRRLDSQGDFSHSETVHNMVEQYRQDVDNVTAFVNECCLVDDDAAVPKTELYEAYQAFCEENGMRPLGRNRFNRRLKEVVTGIKEDKNSGIRKWKGICLANHDNLDTRGGYIWI